MNVSVIKIGGNIIDNEQECAAFLKQFAELKGAKILIHGGGKIASEMGTRLGIQPNMVNGRRITDADTLEVVTMVYGGLVNKNLVASLQALGCNSLGLTGADGNLITAIKRPVGEIDYGFAGDVTGVNTEVLEALLNANFIPVVAPLTHNQQGQLLNTNADTIATELAKALASKGYEVSLRYCFDKPGVMLDLSDPNSLVTEMNTSLYEQLKKQGVIAAGMIPKLHNAFDATNAGVTNVYMGLAENLLQEKPYGTAVLS
ncbi:acetylglutamate kinase [Limibacter armeniacum]|uniref:acetylglutamate kinase n=1 Tax=Limibacter armeniacum TaxID=466084 RepID=UPI002FE688ED